MDHPNIARVLDAGQTGMGRPYFVMELVKGIPITEYCDQAQLAPKERLELFLHVCRAVQHAHQKGIIHRDIKPTNVLVTLHDGTPVPKIIDFGIAKALGQQLTDKTLYTGFAQLMGTPLYMSPEQAALSGLDVDTRSDIYSLGVLLYELLTGTTPFDKERLGTASYDEIRRIIREEEPPKPSTRLSTLALSATLASTQRKSDPKRLSQLVRGELDWIAMKCLEKDRNRRYETANGLARDIQRYLNDEPVQACPPSAWYRFRKLARRNKTILAAAALILCCIATVGAVSGWMMRDRAAREGAVDREVIRAVDEAETLIQSAKIPEALAAVERAEKLLTATGRQEMPGRLAELRNDLAFAQRLEGIYDQPKTEDFLWSHQPADAYAEAFANAGIDLADLSVSEAVESIQARSIRRELVRALDLWSFFRHRSDNQTQAGGPTRSKPDWKQLAEIAAAADPDPLRSQLRQARKHGDRKALEVVAAAPDVEQLPPESLLQLTTALDESGARDKAIALTRRAVLVHPGDFWLNQYLGWWCLTAGPPQYDDAIRYYTASWGIRPRNHVSVKKIGDALAGKNAFPEAVAAYSRAIELKQDYFNAWVGRGELYITSGLWDLAARDYAEAFKVYPPTNPVQCLAQALLRLYVDDSASYRELCANMPKRFNTENVLVGQLNDLVRACTLAAAPEADLGWAARLAEKAVKEAGKKPWDYAALGLAYYRAGNDEAAIEQLRRSLDVDPNWLGGGHNYPVLALAYHRLGREKEARQALTHSARLIDQWSNEFVHRPVGGLLRLQGSSHEAGRPMLWWDWMSCWLLYREAKTVIDGAPPPEDPRLYVVRARALAALGDNERANTACDKALALAGENSDIRLECAIVLGALRRWNPALGPYRKVWEQPPKIPWDHNGLAWRLATGPDAKLRDPSLAIKLATKAVSLAPGDGWIRNTLGVAHYRAGDLNTAIQELEKSMALRKGGDGFDWFFLAMAHWRLGHKDEGLKWYEQAVEWLDKNSQTMAPYYKEQLRRFRAETAELLGTEETK